MPGCAIWRQVTGWCATEIFFLTKYSMGQKVSPSTSAAEPWRSARNAKCAFLGQGLVGRVPAAASAGHLKIAKHRG